MVIREVVREGRDSVFENITSGNQPLEPPPGHSGLNSETRFTNGLIGTTPGPAFSRLRLPPSSPLPPSNPFSSLVVAARRCRGVTTALPFCFPLKSITYSQISNPTVRFRPPQCYSPAGLPELNASPGRPFLFSGAAPPMTARQIRRAQERKAAKLARKSQSASTPEPAQTDWTPAGAPAPEHEEISPQIHSGQRLAANRLNALLSTGPLTPEGKAKSSLNAVKTGLTGRTVLLSSDDAALYAEHCDRFAVLYAPVGPQESALVQSLADTEWRLHRIPALEHSIYAVGRARFAEQYQAEDPALRPGLIELETYLVYEKQLRNLHVQETRLRRQREKDTAELQHLQNGRKNSERDASVAIAPPKSPAKTQALPLAAAASAATIAANGFEFSTLPVQAPSQLLPATYANQIEASMEYHRRD